MSLRKFETFIRKLSRVLYEDDLTPIVIDYLIQHQIAEPLCMSIQLQLKENYSKGEKGIKRVLDRLEAHGLLVKKEVKKSYFKKENGKANLATLIGIPYELIGFPEQPSTVSVYSFHCDLMLILKARLFTLKQIAIQKLDQKRLQKSINYICSRKCTTNPPLVNEIDFQTQNRCCATCRSPLVVAEEKNKLDDFEEQQCRDVVNKLFDEMMTTFNEYRIPPAFFGPLQFVDYDGIGGNFVENVDDAEFIINAETEAKRGASKRCKVDINQLEREVPEIMNFYKNQVLISIKSKAIVKKGGASKKK